MAAVAAAHGLALDGRTLALLCQRVENSVVGEVPGGRGKGRWRGAVGVGAGVSVGVSGGGLGGAAEQSTAPKGGAGGTLATVPLPLSIVGEGDGVLSSSRHSLSHPF